VSSWGNERDDPGCGGAGAFVLTGSGDGAMRWQRVEFIFVPFELRGRARATWKVRGCAVWGADRREREEGRWICASANPGDRLPAIRSFDRSFDSRRTPVRSGSPTQDRSLSVARVAGIGWISLREIQWRRWDVERSKRTADCSETQKLRSSETRGTERS
jgi:hypothetical protein